jgi:flagellar biosynthesis protein FlhB
MAKNNEQDRTEAATPQRRQRAREEGQVAQSNDLTSSVLLFTATICLWFSGPAIGQTFLRSMRNWLRASERPSWGLWETQEMVHISVSEGGQILGVLMALLFLVGLGVVAAQVGFHITWKPLTPDIGRISPVRGWQRLISARSLVRGGLSVVKFVLLATLALWLVSAAREGIGMTGVGTLPQAVSFAWSLTIRLGLTISIFMIVVGLIDTLYQRWSHERDLRMTRQEIQQERREEDGDPHMRARIKKAQRETAMRRSIQAVPGATVVVTNPTHFAVALKYERGAMAAPRVVAKGTDLLALRIKKVAKENGVPVLERKVLARALYRQVEIGQEIPLDFYQAIAEVLAFVYRVGQAG